MQTQVASFCGEANESYLSPRNLESAASIPLMKKTWKITLSSMQQDAALNDLYLATEGWRWRRRDGWGYRPDSSAGYHKTRQSDIKGTEARACNHTMNQSIDDLRDEDKVCHVNETNTKNQILANLLSFVPRYRDGEEIDGMIRLLMFMFTLRLFCETRTQDRRCGKTESERRLWSQLGKRKPGEARG